MTAILESPKSLLVVTPTLSQSDVLAKIQSVLGLDVDSASILYQSLTEDQKNTLVTRLTAIQNGQSQVPPILPYSVQDLMVIFKVSQFQAEKIHAFISSGSLSGGLGSDPTADICLRLIIIAETLGMDLRKTRINVAVTKQGISIKAAGERFDGAKVGFIVSMVFGGISVGGAAGFLGKAGWDKYRNNPQEDKSQWNSPFTLQILTSPGNAGAEYARAQGDFFGGVEDANAVLADNSLQEITDKINVFQGIVQSAAKALG